MANYLFALFTSFIILIHVQTIKKEDLLWYEKLHQLDRLLYDKFRIEATLEAIQNFVKRNTLERNLALVVDATNHHHKFPIPKIDDANDVLLIKKFYGILFELMKLWENAECYCDIHVDTHTICYK
ncbi:CLUMA_CG006362, isoform A [Clunio marinus]|uniref:CLUMA_CG006362, isoform A n=1 Tax=Clunio marinus TaxID=568069 RepID=A0A1J1HX75_9DIPT|nr:CLUMA_CG006362, isoform A [Clunio marinus]